MPRRTASFVATLAVAIALATARGGTAAELTLRLDPGATEVAFDVPATGHDVHGTFALEEGVVRFDPDTGAASGRIVVDARRAATGNASRDKTLHEKVLESAAFPSFVFVPQRLEGVVPEQGAGSVTLVGTLAMHGAEHPLRLPAQVDVRDGALHATVRFPVPYVAWGLHDPSVLFLRVAPEVAVVVEARGTITRPERVAAGAGEPGGR